MVVAVAFIDFCFFLLTVEVGPGLPPGSGLMESSAMRAVRALPCEFSGLPFLLWQLPAEEWMQIFPSGSRLWVGVHVLGII